MFDIHKCQDGREMLIIQMDDEHLVNTINFYCRKLKSARLALTEEVKLPPVAKVLTRHKYDAEEIKERAEHTITELHKKLMPYVMCAALKNINVSVQLIDAYGIQNNEDVPQILDF